MNTIDKEQASQTEEKNTTDYDSAWKDVIEELFEPFMEFFFPQAHRDIDFSKGIEILDSELRDIKPYSNVGKRYADELIKVYLRTDPQHVFVFLSISKCRAQKKKKVYSRNEPMFTITGRTTGTWKKEQKSSALPY